MAKGDQPPRAAEREELGKQLCKRQQEKGFNHVLAAAWGQAFPTP